MEVWLIIIIALSAVVVALVLALTFLVNSRMRSDMQSLKEILNDSLVQTQKILTEIKQQPQTPDPDSLKKLLDDVRSEMSNIVGSELARERARAADKTVATKKEVEAKRQNEAEVETELAEYKKKKEAEIDEKVVRIVAAVVKKVIGETIDPATHEKLILEACEKAKKEGFFNQ